MKLSTRNTVSAVVAIISIGTISRSRSRFTLRLSRFHFPRTFPPFHCRHWQPLRLRVRLRGQNVRQRSLCSRRCSFSQQELPSDEPIPVAKSTSAPPLALERSTILICIWCVESCPPCPPEFTISV